MSIGRARAHGMKRGVLMVSAAVLAIGLATCGSSSKSSSSPTTSSSGTSTSAGGTSGSGSSVITQVFGPGGSSAGQGKTVTVGAALVLSGANQLYGKLVTPGF